MINIYTLEGCSQCEWLIREINKTGLKYHNFDANEYDEQATKLEDLLNTTLYPIVHIEKGSKDIYLISEDLDHYYYTDSIVILSYEDIPHLMQLIKTNIWNTKP